MNHKAYDIWNDSSCPRSGDMTNWIYTLGINTVCSGSFGDQQEVIWLKECWSKAFEQLEQSALGNITVEDWRWRRLDLSLSCALQGMIKSN
ncbi:MAG: hypothetical protein ACKPKO_57665, partial [Candidatus Fonsibacter sp.]